MYIYSEWIIFGKSILETKITITMYKYRLKFTY